MPRNTSGLKQFQKGDPDGRASAAGKVGGKRSVEVQKKKRTMRELARTMANSEITNPKNKAVLKQLGLDEDDMVNSAMVVAGVFKSAQSGNIAAVELE